MAVSRAPVPQGMGIRQAGAMPVMAPQGNIYEDIAGTLGEVGEMAGQYQTRQDMIAKMVQKRQDAAALEASKQEWKEKEFELKEAESERAGGRETRAQEGFEIEKLLGEDKKALEESERANIKEFYTAYNQIDPTLPPKERERAARGLLAGYGGQSPEDFLAKEFKPPGSQAKPRYITTDTGDVIKFTVGSDEGVLLAHPSGGKLKAEKRIIVRDDGEKVTFIDAKTGNIVKTDLDAKFTQKDRNIIKAKLTSINLARRQLKLIQDKFVKGLDFGPLVGATPTESGRAFDRAVDAIRKTMGALTRVPGIGSMSDFETKIDQASMPNRNEYESVTQQQIDGLEQIINTMHEGYTGMSQGRGGKVSPQKDPLNLGIGGAPAGGTSGDPLGLGF